jgi:hypothetical protein
MGHATFVVSDRTDAQAAVEFVTHKLYGYDMHLLDWVRLYPMTAAQHQSQLSGECPPITLSTCWKPRDTATASDPPLPQHKYRIKVNVWQGNDYPAEESNWGRIPPRPIRRRSIPDRYTTRGLCRWRYPDRMAATIHALARPLFLYLANTGQVRHNPSDSNASAWGHRWVVDWLRCCHQESDAEDLIAQLMQWTLIQSRGLPG